MSLVMRITYSPTLNLWFASHGYYDEDGVYQVDEAGELDSADQVDFFFGQLNRGNKVEFYPAGTLPAN